MSFNEEIFKGKTFSDLFEENYINVATNRRQLDVSVHQVMDQIEDIQDAAVIVPLLEKLYSLKLKNEELNIKMVSIAEKMAKADASIEGGGFSLSPEELADIVKRSDEIAGQVDNLSNGFKS